MRGLAAGGFMLAAGGCSILSGLSDTAMPDRISIGTSAGTGEFFGTLSDPLSLGGHTGVERLDGDIDIDSASLVLSWDLPAAGEMTGRTSFSSMRSDFMNDYQAWGKPSEGLISITKTVDEQGREHFELGVTEALTGGLATLASLFGFRAIRARRKNGNGDE